MKKAVRKQHMKKHLLNLFALTMLGFVLIFVPGGKGDEPQGESTVISGSIAELITSTGMYQLKAGTVAPDFQLKAVDGRTVSLSDYRGKVVLLSFWTTW